MPPISDWPVHIKTQLKGPVELLKPARDVTLSLDASLSKTHVVVRELLAASGPGRLQAQGEVHCERRREAGYPCEGEG